MKKLTVFLLSTLILLSACSVARMAEQRFPDRQKFSFSSPSTGTENIYLCKKSATKSETKARATAAHIYVNKRLSEVTNEMLEKMFEEGKSSIFAAMGASFSMSKGAGVVAKEVEEKFQCTLIEAKG